MMKNSQVLLWRKNLAVMPGERSSDDVADLTIYCSAFIIQQKR